MPGIQSPFARLHQELLKTPEWLYAEEKPVVTLVGPTAVGKTAAGVYLAQALNGEIISLDSRQIYRGMVIGTAAPSTEEQHDVPHHLIGSHDIDEPISAGRYAALVYEIIEQIRNRGRLPILVGGATLYLRAVQTGLSDIPPVDPDIRKRLNERVQSEGAATLFEELRAIDPVAASTMDPTKSNRIVRALEVYLGTGRTLSSWYGSESAPPYRYLTTVLYTDRASLHDRQNARVDQMLSAGLIEEVSAIVQSCAGRALPAALNTIGYKEVIQYLKGALSYEDLSTLIKKNTRQYAKRQITWFRRYPDYYWYDVQTGRFGKEQPERLSRSH